MADSIVCDDGYLKKVEKACGLPEYKPFWGVLKAMLTKKIRFEQENI